MRIAAIYDIHGNLPALEAVLADIHLIGVDELIVGGDVFPGPMPRESLDLLLSLPMPVTFLLGNGDREVQARMMGVETPWYAAAQHPWREPVRWTAEQLSATVLVELNGWHASLRRDIPGIGETFFCHATPNSDTLVFTRRTPDECLDQMVADLRAQVMVCGHTHMQFDRTVGGVRIVNAGSVGMPYGEPGAYWLLLGPDVQLRHTSYDLPRAAERIRATNYPQASAFAANHVLNPPSAETMVEVFEKIAMR